MSPATEPPIAFQERFWNEWNHRYLESKPVASMAQKRADAVLARIARLRLVSPNILEIGCGNGWFSEMLAPLGPVTGIDLAAEVISRAQIHRPHIRFVAGDILSAPFPPVYDLVVTMETIAHVADQALFVDRIFRALKPGGYLVLTAQNRFVFERRDDVAPQAPGLLRRWLNRTELRRLLMPRFQEIEIATIAPAGHRGLLRLINSYRLNSLSAAVLGQPRLDAAKERLGLGQTLVAVARRR